MEAKTSIKNFIGSSIEGLDVLNLDLDVPRSTINEKYNKNCRGFHRQSLTSWWLFLENWHKDGGDLTRMEAMDLSLWNAWEKKEWNNLKP